MTDQELIVWQARKIAQLQLSVDFWSGEYTKLQTKINVDAGRMEAEKDA